VLILVATAYVALLFAIAYYGDRMASRVSGPLRRPWVYSLALGVYATSWTFYGAVGRASTSGLDFLPIYIGPILVFVFGAPLLRRIIQVSKRRNITSIADFISARYGRHHGLAMLVTVISVVGVLPYIALQIKAVAFSFQVLAGPQGTQNVLIENSALFISGLLAVFVILFGTRQIVSSESHHGLVSAIAFESVVKLGAFVAVGLFATFSIFNGVGDAYKAAMELPEISAPLGEQSWQVGFMVQTLLAMAAIICLPRQFQVTVVENTALDDLRTARWVFPLFLALISFFVMPIAAAGLLKHPHFTPDTYVLALPLKEGNVSLALLAYLGGFSAATGMVIVETIALSTMICNELVLPLTLRMRKGLAQRGDLSLILKAIRRVAIVAIIGFAYLYYRLFTGPGSLASIGLLSFAAVLQFAPSLVGGIYWHRGNYFGAICGLVAGFAVWCYTLLIPTLLGVPPTGIPDPALQPYWLPSPVFLGVNVDWLTHGTLWSISANLLCYVAGSFFGDVKGREREYARRFLQEAQLVPAPQSDSTRKTATVGDLQRLLERFFGTRGAKDAIAEYATQRGQLLPALEVHADPDLARFTERFLAGALGASTARLLLAQTLREREVKPEEVFRLLDETSHVIQFNRELLRATLEHLSQGISVVDENLRLVAWNKRYLELFEYPAEIVSVGKPIADLIRYNAERGLLGSGDVEQLVERRVEHMRKGHAYAHERDMPDGTVLEIRGNPMPGGGFVTSYSNVTAYKRAQRELIGNAETLELRVHDRTRQLTVVNMQLAEAKFAAERANEAKTRFLAIASHDLVQPLNAARLFLSSLSGRTLPTPVRRVLNQVENSLTSAESLLAGLFDISRLDARTQEVHLEDFRLDSLLKPLAQEFEMLADKHGLEFRLVACRQVVRSDRQLLRRVLQNFLSNAVRYTAKGRILMGCRRAARTVRIEIWDTGPGIPPKLQKEVFQEFRRIETKEAHGERGLGLGLAIAERIASMLNHPLSLRSWPGKGSVFSITVPMGEPARIRAPRTRWHSFNGLEGSVVLCLENEPTVLSAMGTLLGSWGCRVILSRNGAEASAHFRRTNKVPDAMLIDYHLDDGVNGIEEAASLLKLWGVEVPGIVTTADHTQQAREDALRYDFALLPKPLKPAALRALLTRVLAQRAKHPAA
jgi:Na+/proline symporter/signal transduction histidine kinase